ncbi:uncharacterized protein LOC132273346 [Cornus florida]|uniref:uncharacterized protein LOC132273346 n=1 Tax=Cornus florida TaxID=4283 RepID=UPI00289D3281|nr:uncharacterized protein LOC132273346 [Cornus florida]
MSSEIYRDTTKYSPLHKALVKGDLESVKAFLERDPNAISVPISTIGERAIHIAVAEEHVQLVEELVTMINPVFLEFTQDDGDTALHIAARGANTTIAKSLVESNGELVKITDQNGHVPVTLAAIFGNTEMFNYLHSVTSQQDIIPRIVNIHRPYFDYLNYRVYAMFIDSIKGENYGFALNMLEVNPELASGGLGRGIMALYTVAEMPFAFSSRNRLGKLKRWMYNCKCLYFTISLSL